VAELSYRPGPAFFTDTRIATGFIPGTTWVPESRSGSITDRIVTIRVVPGAGTRRVAPTGGSAGGGAVLRAAAAGAVAAGPVRVAGGAGREIV
jgi:hypothetical protein